MNDDRIRQAILEHFGRDMIHPIEGEQFGLIGSDPIRCYENALFCVEEYGGAVVHGWAVWTRPEKLWLWLQHHCIWKTENNELVDVTPAPTFEDEDERIGFVIDENLDLENRTYSFGVTRAYRDSQHILLSKSKRAKEQVAKAKREGWEFRQHCLRNVKLDLALQNLQAMQN